MPPNIKFIKLTDLAIPYTNQLFSLSPHMNTISSSLQLKQKWKQQNMRYIKGAATMERKHGQKKKKQKIAGHKKRENDQNCV